MDLKGQHTDDEGRRTDLEGQRHGAAPRGPCSTPIPHPITIQNMRFRRQKIYYGKITSNYITYYYIILYDIIQYLQYSIQVAPA